MVPSGLADGAAGELPTSADLVLSSSPSRACSLLICSRNSSSCLRNSCTFWLEESDCAKALAGAKTPTSKATAEYTSLEFFNRPFFEVLPIICSLHKASFCLCPSLRGISSTLNCHFLQGRLRQGPPSSLFFVDYAFARMESSALELQLLRESASST